MLSIKRKNILFVVSYQFMPIGGHLLSAISLAKQLRQEGHNVGLLVHPVTIPDFDNTEIRIHSSTYSDSVIGKLRRSLDIYRTVGQYRYDVIVAMDSKAIRQSFMALLRFVPYAVQVLPGGPLPLLPPLRLPGILVFSEELFIGLQSHHKIRKENLILSQGRIDFPMYQRAVVDVNIGNNSLLGFDRQKTRVLAISRLPNLKAKAVSALLDQVEQVAQQEQVQLRIVGDGEARKALEKQAAAIVQSTQGRADIRFLGGFRVTATHLREADLVIGQGRTVLEALASGVPAAVCGNNGYCGLLTTNTFPALSKTNLTGRSTNLAGHLAEDLQYLEQYRRSELDLVFNLAVKTYGSESGSLALNTIVSRLEENLPLRTNRFLQYLRSYFQDLETLAEWYTRNRIRLLRRYLPL